MVWRRGIGSTSPSVLLSSSSVGPDPCSRDQLMADDRLLLDGSCTHFSAPDFHFQPPWLLEFLYGVIMSSSWSVFLALIFPLAFWHFSLCFCPMFLLFLLCLLWSSGDLWSSPIGILLKHIISIFSFLFSVRPTIPWLGVLTLRGLMGKGNSLLSGTAFHLSPLWLSWEMD